jgi:hypothetical protein
MASQETVKAMTQIVRGAAKATKTGEMRAESWKTIGSSDDVLGGRVPEVIMAAQSIGMEYESLPALRFVGKANATLDIFRWGRDWAKIEEVNVDERSYNPTAQEAAAPPTLVIAAFASGDMNGVLTFGDGDGAQDALYTLAYEVDEALGELEEFHLREEANAQVTKLVEAARDAFGLDIIER